ncbi:C39 family peptidase [Bacillus sp. MUM 13]|uniref:C39 family peptidase n=1 Tax=Bacillus sp. MUM 13 TaxID=1678001 RepID=UPI0008F5CC7D|nr:C39 family peptidase [Bacillus sp. MUM 13]OIK06801.1 hypothetical protein BIV59_21260 [Bacillus sp. MUM 13]
MRNKLNRNKKKYIEFKDFENLELIDVINHKNHLSLKKSVSPSIKEDCTEYYFGYVFSPYIYSCFKEAVVSWGAKAPPGTWLEFEIRPIFKDRIGKWYSLGLWLESANPFSRHSQVGQDDLDGSVHVDTLMLENVAEGFQIRAKLASVYKNISPILKYFGVSLSLGRDRGEVQKEENYPDQKKWCSLCLPVPKKSQMLYMGGEVFCSPTSVSMILNFWAEKINDPPLKKSVPKVVKGVWDKAYKGAGNWSFNTAYVASLGLYAIVARLSSLKKLEQLILLGIPVIVSIAYEHKSLDGAPLSFTNGHLVVVKGFSDNGNVLVNDPAGATNDEVEKVYNRNEFENAWLNGSDGTSYLIYPLGYIDETLFQIN